ncbi:MAG: hypothetical protein ACI8UO_002337 [Verrucomicrobiales bacterium]|jgi:hypothetical protein
MFIEMPELVDIGQTLLNAAVFNLKSNENSSIAAHAMIPNHVEEFLDLLKENEVDCVLVGGLAMLSHLEGRNTQDIDLIVGLKEIRELPGIEISENDEHFALAAFKTLRVDILRAEFRFFRTIKENHSEVRPFADREISCATPLGLILMKLFALPVLYRQFLTSKVTIYEGDIQNLLAQFPTPHAEIVKLLQPHVPTSELKELESILTEIEGRIERMSSNRFGYPESD